MTNIADSTGTANRILRLCCMSCMPPASSHTICDNLLCVQKSCCCGHCSDKCHFVGTACSCLPPVQGICDDKKWEFHVGTTQQPSQPAWPMLHQQSNFWQHERHKRLTWSLEAHEVRQSSAALHSGSWTHAKICLPHLVPIFQIVDRSFACMLFTKGTCNHAA